MKYLANQTQSWAELTRGWTFVVHGCAESDFSSTQRQEIRRRYAARDTGTPTLEWLRAHDLFGEDDAPRP